MYNIFSVKALLAFNSHGNSLKCDQLGPGCNNSSKKQNTDTVSLDIYEIKQIFFKLNYFALKPKILKR